ncbi:Na(+)/H(+) exchange regulatory cofactor NHE-RF2, partial [Clarias magur]
MTATTTMMKDDSVQKEMEERNLRPRLCYLTKGERGYGFHLHGERGSGAQFIRRIEAGSPAELAGLRSGDRVVEVVQKIMEVENRTRLLVVDRETDEFLHRHSLPCSEDLAVEMSCLIAPRTASSSLASSTLSFSSLSRDSLTPSPQGSIILLPRDPSTDIHSVTPSLLSKSITLSPSDCIAPLTSDSIIPSPENPTPPPTRKSVIPSPEDSIAQASSNSISQSLCESFMPSLVTFITQSPYESITQTPSDSIPQSSCNSIIQSPSDSIPQSSCNSIIQSPYDSIPQSPSNSMPQSPYDSIPQSPSNSTPQSPYDSITQSPSNSMPQSHYDSILQSPSNSTPLSPYDSIPQSPSNSMLQSHYDSILQSPSNSTPQSPYDSIPQSPSNSMLQSHYDSILQSPSNSIPQSPSKSITTSFSREKSDETPHTTDIIITTTSTKETSGTDDMEMRDLRPRLCHIVKNEQGFGFNLHCDKRRVGHFIRSVDPDSPAQRAGLQPGDRLIQVNGRNIEGLRHAEVVKIIQSGGGQTKMLVVDPETDILFQKLRITPTTVHLNEDCVDGPIIESPTSTCPNTDGSVSPTKLPNGSMMQPLALIDSPTTNGSLKHQSHGSTSSSRSVASETSEELSTSDTKK